MFIFMGIFLQLIFSLQILQDVSTVAILDITNKETEAWLRNKLTTLKNSLGENVVFFVDSSNAFHMPTYFEVEKKV